MPSKSKLHRNYEPISGTLASSSPAAVKPVKQTSPMTRHRQPPLNTLNATNSSTTTFQETRGHSGIQAAHRFDHERAERRVEAEEEIKDVRGRRGEERREAGSVRAPRELRPRQQRSVDGLILTLLLLF